jgi:hypothetical protein
MAGLGLFFHKRKGPFPGTKGFASICPCFFVLNLHKKCQGATRKKRFFGPPSEALVVPPPTQKPSQKTPKPNFCRLTIQEPVFSVSNTEFEGGDDGHGYGEDTFFLSHELNPAM